MGSPSHISSLGKPEHCFITKTTKTRSSRRSSFAIAISRECHSGASQCHEGLSYEPWEQADGRVRRKNARRRRNPRQLTELPHAADKSPEGIFPACRPGFWATGLRGGAAVTSSAVAGEFRDIHSPLLINRRATCAPMGLHRADTCPPTGATHRDGSQRLRHRRETRRRARRLPRGDRTTA